VKKPLVLITALLVLSVSSYTLFAAVARQVKEVPATVSVELAPPGSLRLEYLLQGVSRPVPEGWIKEMQVVLFQSGREMLSTTVTGSYDSVRSVGFLVIAVPAGAFHIYLRAPPSLANVKRNVELTGGEDTVNMGALLTGNGAQTPGITSTADIIDGTDFSILSGSFFKGVGDPGYDDRADYDGNLFIDGTDFSLLAGNFFISGPVEIPP